MFKSKQSIFILIAVAAVLLLVLQFADIASGGAAGYEKTVAQERADKDRWLRSNAESPLPDSLRKAFAGLPYYPTAVQWQLQAQYVPHTSPQKIDTLSTGVVLAPAGVVQFTHQGAQHSLLAWYEAGSEKNKLFIAFRDATCGQGSYGGGRYLSVALGRVGAQDVVLDFNRAYHPYCVYNITYVCPVPPKQNTLPFAVAAGEKM